MRPPVLLCSLAVLICLIIFLCFNSRREIEAEVADPVIDPVVVALKDSDFEEVSTRSFDSLLRDKNQKLAATEVYIRPRASGSVKWSVSQEWGRPSPKSSLYEVAVEGLRRSVESDGYEVADFADVVLRSQATTQHNGVSHVYLRQQVGGIQVYNGDANANFDKQGQLISLHNSFVKDIQSEINTHLPSIDAAAAVIAAAEDLGMGAVSALEMDLVSPSRGASQKALLENEEISRDPIPARLMYLPQPEGETRLVWNVVIHTPEESQWMDMNVDAVTGEVLSRVNWYASADYKVYPLPYESPMDGSQQVVTDPHDETASPYGWHDTNGNAGADHTDTRGNNVLVQDDTDANNSGGTRPDGGDSLSFDYTVSLSQSPSAYLDASSTNLFYWNNIAHDIFYRYGFDESAGNFQENNYGRGGSASDGVYADSQDGGDFNNANFATPPDGSNPRMQMFLWDRTSPLRDSGLDSTVIIHEYGHGVSSRLTGGRFNSSALGASQSRAMGEGWSDFLALALTAESSHTSTQRRPIGYYSIGRSATSVGIRPAAYTTNMSVNNYTFRNMSGAGLSEPHGVGFLWCTILWEMYWELVNKHGFDADIYNGTGGNNMAIQLVIDGMKLQPANPTFLSARDAILQADQQNNSGENRDEIWRAFAKRGMGFSATDSGDPNNMSVTEAYDVPDERFSVDDVRSDELDSGSRDYAFTISLSAAAEEAVSVDYATANGTASAGSDFQASSGTVSFAIGESFKTVNIPVYGDTQVEEDETFEVRLSNPVNGVIADGAGIGTIITDDFTTPSITSALSAEASVGSQFSYTIVAVNSARSFSLGSNAPAGMSVNASTGVVTWSPSEVGTFSVDITATNPAGSDTRSLVITVNSRSLAGALDTALDVTTSSRAWFWQDAVTYDGVDAAASADVSNNQSSSFEVEIQGPADVEFWWKVSSEWDFDFLEYYENDRLVTDLSGERNWRKVSRTFAAGNHVLKWQYIKDDIFSEGQDRGWVDSLKVTSLLEAQTISFASIEQQFIDTSLALNASGGDSGNPVTFVVSSGPASINQGNVVTFSGTGSVTITASQAGNSTYAAAEEVSRSFQVVDGQMLFEQAAADAGLSGADALATAVPFHDGISNLERYAFNLPLATGVTAPMVQTTGTSGLPGAFVDWVGDQSYWNLHYVRRLNSGVAYNAVGSRSVDGEYVVVTADTVEIDPINEMWERVRLRAQAPSHDLYLKVQVSLE